MSSSTKSSADTTTTTLPPCRMLLRSKDGVELYNVPSPPLQERNWLLKGSTTLQVISPNGKYAYIHQAGVGVIKCDLEQSTLLPNKPFLQNSEKVSFMCCSPKGTYLLTWEKLNPNQAFNLKVWNAVSGELECGFVQKNIRKDAWPYIQWTHDERYAFLLATNEVRVYEGNAFSSKEEVRYIDKMRCQGVVSMSVPEKVADATTTSDSYLLSVFVPTTKDKPGRVSLLQYPCQAAVKTSSNNPQGYPALVSKSLYQVEDVAVHWSPRGDSALVSMQTSVDTTGESYYGSATLYLFTTKDVLAVPLPNNSSDGPVLNVAWMPNPSKPPCFGVESGKMPSMASLHHGSTAEPIFLFGNAHRNTISWSPHGRFVCLAGFGNLQGGMTFWDRNKLKVIPQYEGNGKTIELPQPVAHCTVGYGWSPDSRLFYSSTTSPRMNVDNGVCVFKYNGQELSTAELPWKNEWYQPDRLLQAEFLPATTCVYPDRPQSPPPKGVTVGDESTAATTAVAAPPPKKPAGRYVPPGARGKASSGTSLAERMRREKESSMMGATKITKTSSQSIVGGNKKVIPGMAPESSSSNNKSSKKNAARKERLKAAKAKQQQQEEAAAAAAKQQQQQPVDPEKRARKIKKTLKQIEELKGKDDLNEDQKKKIANEKSLLDELAKLGL